MIEAVRNVTIAPHAGLSIGAFEMLDRSLTPVTGYRFGQRRMTPCMPTFAAEDCDQPQEAFHFLAPDVGG